ncbi:MAG: PilZ domain-containing protein, partial [Bdellovibrionota bacterium]
MADFKGIEARRTPRRVFNRAIGVLHGGRYSIQQALQLSEGGMLFTSDSRFANGERIVATVLLPGGDGILFQAEIIYGRPGLNGSFQYGVKFNGVGIHHKRMIRNYV